MKRINTYGEEHFLNDVKWWTGILFLISFLLISKMPVRAFSEDAMLRYCEYLETHSLNEYLGGFSLYGGANWSYSDVYKLELSDFDWDGEM